MNDDVPHRGVGKAADGHFHPIAQFIECGLTGRPEVAAKGIVQQKSLTTDPRLLVDDVIFDQESRAKIAPLWVIDAGDITNIVDGSTPPVRFQDDTAIVVTEGGDDHCGILLGRILRVALVWAAQQTEDGKKHTGSHGACPSSSSSSPPPASTVKPATLMGEVGQIAVFSKIMSDSAPA